MDSIRASPGLASEVQPVLSLPHGHTAICVNHREASLSFGPPGRDPEQELQSIQRRFRAVTARHDRKAWRLRLAKRILIGIGIVALLLSALWSISPWPLMVTLRHLGAAPNCSAARFFDLAPARRGKPGYYQRHDADADGIACEPWDGR